ncbi:FAD-dependent oxidoreductase [Gordonia sp. (in: high G+C Gram-positive bacteria)]|uniref:FAD-dependent oxidoreductase n=1 Tax=Gordonia sp. (in: high G+C Gram-positive bacteria) TaxID=84139 RepID=UPI003BB6B7EA
MGAQVTVVGGGAVGLTCALAAIDDGWRVRIYDDGPQRRAAQVAGGMLGCLGEAGPGDDALLELSAESVARWPALLARLNDPNIVVADDTLLIAGSAADRAYLDDAVAFLQARLPGARIVAQSASELRAREPALTRAPSGGYRLTGEGAVDNRAFLAALRRRLVDAGAELVERRVDDVADLAGEATQVLIAAGLESSSLVPGGLPGLRGEKGEILRLRRTAESVPPPRHVIRGRWHGRNVYLVPRPGGLVLGATQYESYDHSDRGPQAGGVADLLTDACELFPGLRTYELVEVSAGIRPMSDDGLPIVRRLDDRTIVAAGHGRNGFALSPGTAQQVRKLLGSPADYERNTA